MICPFFINPSHFYFINYKIAVSYTHLKQSEKLRFLINSLVKLSRLENGIISLSPQQAALQPLLESVVEQYTAKASEKGLSLRLQDTDAFAVFDFKWTAEALANIVDNAIKYTEHGTITISAVSYEMSVSYTHLDVYKRQAPHRFGIYPRHRCP